MGSFDYENLVAASSNQSTQGTLSSQYTNWVEAQVQSAADAIAYHWYAAGGSLDAAIAIRDALLNGEFSVGDLFLAANGKSSLGGDLPGQPHPTLTVADTTIDLTDFFGSGTHVTEWTSGNVKNLQYHAREYLTDFDAGNAPPDWDHPPTVNHSPEATPFSVSFEETQSVFENHARTNTGEDWQTVNLLDGAADPDGDPLHTTGTILINDKPLSDFDSYIKLVGNELQIDVNSRELDYLKADPNDPDHSLTLTVTYQVTDDHNDPVSTSATITITGTTDEYHEFGEGSVSTTHHRSDSTEGGGKINGNVLSFDNPLPSDAFDFHFAGTLTAQESGLTDNQKVNVSDATPTDWGSAINLDAGHPSETVTLASTALDDHQINYNVGFNTSDGSDSVKVTLDYNYDYWHMA
jgi:hypothetical protein